MDRFRGRARERKKKGWKYAEKSKHTCLQHMKGNTEASWMGIQASSGRLLQRAARWMLHG